MSLTFQQLGLHPDLLRAVEELGYSRPTPIQVEAIPILMEGRDLIGCAQTGTGKTAAFLLPILHRLIGKENKRLKALVLEPTRELAVQVEEQMEGLAKFTDIRGAAVFGGVGMGPQEKAFKTGVEVIAATPGRLLDHMGRGNVSFDSLEFLILDEADRMLDMGFIPDVRRILRKVPRKRQSMLFSATIPYEVECLAWEFLHEPVTVRTIPRSEPAHGITHAVYPVPEHLKGDLLMRLLREHPMSSVLIFTRTKIRADRLSQRLYRAGFPVMVMHGDRSQRERQDALESFKRGECQILVATDIAARGLDVEKISHVINYDVPQSAEDYLHRVGRTARAGEVGDAFTLVAPLEEIDMYEFEQTYGLRLPRVTLPDFNYDVAPPDFRSDRRDRSGRVRRDEPRWKQKDSGRRPLPGGDRGVRAAGGAGAGRTPSAATPGAARPSPSGVVPGSRDRQPGGQEGGRRRNRWGGTSQQRGSWQPPRDAARDRRPGSGGWSSDRRDRGERQVGLTAALSEERRNAPIVLTPAASGSNPPVSSRDGEVSKGPDRRRRRRRSRRHNRAEGAPPKKLTTL